MNNTRYARKTICGKHDAFLIEENIMYNFGRKGILAKILGDTIMAVYHRGGKRYPDIPDYERALNAEHALTDEYSWGLHNAAAFRKDPDHFGGFDYEFAGDFMGEFDYGNIASMTECTGLIPNGMTNDFEGLSYAELYENVHQPEGDYPDEPDREEE